jgi:hypothetical protein
MHYWAKAFKMLSATCISLLCFIATATAQKAKDPLFDNQQPLDIGLHIDIRTVAKTKKDSVYLPHRLYYKTTGTTYDSIKVKLKSRGNFRLSECYFPPLWVKMEGKNTKGSCFEGTKKLKLVVPCYNRSESNALIIRELLCYKLYELISPYYFKTRLVNIDFKEKRGKKEKQFALKGILIEDLEKTAKRFHGEAMETMRISPAALQDTCILRFGFFQYMISNTDLSSTHQHNTKLIKIPKTGYVSMPYDFDMSGLVDAPYAVVSQVGDETLSTESVRDRVYRGYCRSEDVAQCVRKEFLAKKEKLLALADEYKNELTEKEIKGIKKYLEDFFRCLEDDGSFRRNMLNVCRPIQ